MPHPACHSACCPAPACSKNDPKVLAQRAERQAELDRAVEQMLKDNPGKVLRWDQERIMKVRATCRCHWLLELAVLASLPAAELLMTGCLRLW